MSHLIETRSKSEIDLKPVLGISPSSPCPETKLISFPILTDCSTEIVKNMIAHFNSTEQDYPNYPNLSVLLKHSSLHGMETEMLAQVQENI